MGFSLNLVSLLAITIVTEHPRRRCNRRDREHSSATSAWANRPIRHPSKPPMKSASRLSPSPPPSSPSSFRYASWAASLASTSNNSVLAIAAAVFFSLLVARLITPLLAAYYIARQRPCRKRRLAHQDLYAPRRMVRPPPHRDRHPRSDGPLLCRSIPFNCCPQASCHLKTTARFLIAVELPPGSKLEDTKKVTREISRRISARPEITSIFTSGGRILPAGDEVRKATLVITAVAKAKRKLTQVATETGHCRATYHHS